MAQALSHLKMASARLSAVRQASAMRWNDFEADVSAATARLRRSTDKAKG